MLEELSVSTVLSVTSGLISAAAVCAGFYLSWHARKGKSQKQIEADRKVLDRLVREAPVDKLKNIIGSPGQRRA